MIIVMIMIIMAANKTVSEISNCGHFVNAVFGQFFGPVPPSDLLQQEVRLGQTCRSYGFLQAKRYVHDHLTAYIRTEP